MSDMLQTVIPKSDQLNADSLIGGKTITVKITNVSLGKDEQPVSISYEGDNGRPFKPCKSMRRVLIHAWGESAAQYVGRSMTLYCDPTVKYAGTDVGGIRISHLSHIDKEMIVALTATKASRKPFSVLPLNVEAAPTLDDLLTDISAAPTIEGMEFKYKAAYRAFKDEESRAKIVAAKDKRKVELTPPAVIE